MSVIKGLGNRGGSEGLGIVLSIAKEAADLHYATHAYGGATHNFETRSLVPVGPDVTPEQNRFIAGGVSNPATGEQFLTIPISKAQFTPHAALSQMVEGRLKAGNIPQANLGTWTKTNKAGERVVDVDISDIHRTRREAMVAGEMRHEEAIFETRSMKSPLTSWGKKIRNAKVPARKAAATAAHARTNAAR